MNIKIYEFSRGIKVIGTPKNWQSQGFSGETMNSSFEPVPQAIKVALRNRLFSAVESDVVEKPALVGREVEDEQGKWSMMAVISRGWDDARRPFSAYRYFWCEGHGNLTTILRWWYYENERLKKLLVFDPFESPKIWQVEEDELKILDKSHDITANFTHFLDETLSLPIISDWNDDFGKSLPPTVVNKIAEKHAKNTGQLVAWAYNVEALESPKTFQFIFASNQQANENFQRVINAQSDKNSIVFNELEIKKVIDSLIQNRVNSEYINVLENALSNSLIHEKYWQELFNSKGAKDALRTGYYSGDMIRLLTLQAIILPNTLPIFLNWLAKKDKQIDKDGISREFQLKFINDLKNSCPNISNSIAQGITLVIANVINDPQSLDSIVWLLGLRHGCWAWGYRHFIENQLEQDLCNLKNNYNNLNLVKYKEFDKIYKKIFYIGYKNYPKDRNYQYLADLFYKLENYKISSFLYQISFGFVPSEVFSNLDLFGAYNYKIRTELYGLTVEKKLNLVDKFFYHNFNLQLPIFVFLLLTCYALGWFGGFFANKFIFSEPEKLMRAATNKIIENDNKLSQQKKEIQKNLIDILGSDELPKKDYFNDLKREIVCKVDDENNDNYFCGVDEAILNNAVKEFAKTKKILKSIEDNLVKIQNSMYGNNYTPLEIREKFVKEIDVDDVNTLDKAINSNEVTQDQKVVVYKIYKYQEKNNIQPPTGILDEKTKSQLLTKISPSLNTSPSTQ